MHDNHYKDELALYDEVVGILLSPVDHTLIFRIYKIIARTHFTVMCETVKLHQNEV